MEQVAYESVGELGKRLGRESGLMEAVNAIIKLPAGASATDAGLVVLGLLKGDK